jgi:hypothetical protein
MRERSLSRQAKCAAEIRLAYCQHHPAHAHPAADVLVDGIWGLLADGIHYRFRIEKSTHVPTGTNARRSKRCARSEGLPGVMIATYLQRLNEVSHV